MEKRWVYKEIPEEEKVNALSESINVQAKLATLLVQRGVENFEEARQFFRPSLDQLHDPFLMKGMQLAVERLNRAIKDCEKILIYGDYDVDGTTSVALFYHFLHSHYSRIEFYIPDRYKEGYGLSELGMQYAKDHGFSLIITLDCGIKAVDIIKEANQQGIDFIICDHHNPGKELPPAHAILDPKQLDCPYPYKELTGCGVGFKLLQGWCLDQEMDQEPLLELLDLLVVSIASDIVPISGENRILSYFGLKRLNEAPRPGLKALINLAMIRKEINITSIVFGIGPRINAAGRIAHAKAAVELLLSTTDTEAIALAKGIESKNTMRRDFDLNITQEALDLIESDEALRNARSTVLFKHGWHKGVIGIVASRCIEKYHRPTIILTESNNKATGSARSVNGFDVYQAIAKCAEYLDQFGGHAFAAGLTLDLDKVEPFRQRFEEVVAESIRDEQLIPQEQIDLDLHLQQVDWKFQRILKQMAPFGPGNMKPVFVSKEVFAASRPRVLKEAHLKMYVKQEGMEQGLPAIGFGMADYFEMISSGMRFHLAYTIEENNFMGRKELQLVMKDVKFDN